MSMSDHSRCEKCHQLPKYTAGMFYEFFWRRPVKCHHRDCGRPFADWWSTVRDSLEKYRSPIFIFPALRHTQTSHQFTLHPRQRVILNLHHHRIVPPTAVILGIEYMSLDGFLMPVEDTGWELSPADAEKLRNADGTYQIPIACSRSLSRLQLSHILCLYGAEPSGGVSTPATVQVVVDWVEPDEAEVAATPLFMALEAFAMGRYGAALMMAQQVGEVKAEQLLQESDSYCNQLQKLDETARAARVPGLDRSIWRILHRLRQKRNRVAHGAASHSQPTRDELADFLCATIFGVHYVNFLINAMRRKQERMRTSV